MSENDLIKSIITLFDFIVQIDDGGVPLFNKTWSWLNPKAFTGVDFNQKLINLSDETKEILIEIQDNYKMKFLKLVKGYKNILVDVKEVSWVCSTLKMKLRSLFSKKLKYLYLQMSF